MAKTIPDDEKLSRLYEEWKDRAQELTASWLSFGTKSVVSLLCSFKNANPPTHPLSPWGRSGGSRCWKDPLQEGDLALCCCVTIALRGFRNPACAGYIFLGQQRLQKSFVFHSWARTPGWSKGWRLRGGGDFRGNSTGLILISSFILATTLVVLIWNHFIFWTLTAGKARGRETNGFLGEWHSTWLRLCALHSDSKICCWQCFWIMFTWSLLLQEPPSPKSSKGCGKDTVKAPFFGEWWTLMTLVWNCDETCLGYI